jgi:hypothetical protein
MLEERHIPAEVRDRTGPSSTTIASKNILIISGFRIFPTRSGGHVHSAGIARSLARMGHRVRVYSVAARYDDYNLRSLLPRSHRIDVIETNLVEETNLGLFFGVLQGLGRRLDLPRVWQHWLLRNAWIPSRLKKALREADIILSDTPWCPPVPGPWNGKPWYLVSHNLEHRLLEQGSPRHRRFTEWMLGVELDAPARYTDIFPCAEADRNFFSIQESARHMRLPIIRCGVDPGDYKVPAGTREKIRGELGLNEEDTVVVFSGSRFGPNLEALEALREFCLRESEFLASARVRILVLGSIVSEPFRAGAMIATGRVAEVVPYFAAADVGLNPITRGSGANVKLFEYLTMRLPVISTLFGVRGTTLVPDIDFIAYEPANLRAAIDRFLHDRTRERWRTHAEQVWSRHRSSCDIGEVVKRAIADLPEFQRVSPRPGSRASRSR